MSRANTLERQMLDLINNERTSRGLDPLELELRLNASSEDHSEWMLDRDVFSHTGSNGSSAGDRMRDADFNFSGNWTWGENIAWQSERGATGLTDDVANLHTSLMNSPGHRANILNPDFEVIGIGIERADYRGYDAVMVTQNFAATDAPLQIDQGTQPPEPEPQPEPQPDPEPTENTPPTVFLSRMTFSPGEWLDAGKLVKYRDADGDAPQYFTIRNKLDAFRIEINGEEVSGSNRYRIAAEDIGTVRITADNVGDRGNMDIRAHDGTEWSDWDSFRLRVVEPAAPALPEDDTVVVAGTAAGFPQPDELPQLPVDDMCFFPEMEQDVFLMA